MPGLGPLVHEEAACLPWSQWSPIPYGVQDKLHQATSFQAAGDGICEEGFRCVSRISKFGTGHWGQVDVGKEEIADAEGSAPVYEWGCPFQGEWSENKYESGPGDDQCTDEGDCICIARGSPDMHTELEGGHEKIKKKCSKALEETLEGNVPESDKDVEKLGNELISRNFCYKAMYKPLNPTSKSDDGSEKKPKKWPDRLGRTPNQSFDCEGFYVITYESGTGLQHFLLALIIGGVLLACMFPVWPMWAKVGVWYLSVIFLTLYFGVLILRMVIFTMFWVIGFDFWIFPNLNDEYCGLLDSFQPFYSWEKRKDDALMLLVRFVSLGIAAVAIQQIAENTSFEDVQDLVKSSYADVLAWGVDKLTALPGSEKQALPSVEELQKEKDLEDSEGNVTGVTAEMAEDDDDDKADNAAPAPAPAEEPSEE